MERKVNTSMLGMVAILIATIIYLYTKLEYAYFSVITTFILIQKFYSDIYLKIIERIMGPTTAFALTFFIIKFLQDCYVLYIFISLSIVFIFAYYYAYQYYAYAMLWAVMTCALMTNAAYVSTTELGIRLGFFWIINIIIGALVALVTDYGFKKFLKIPIQFQAIKKDSVISFFSRLWKVTRKFEPVALIIATRITLTVLIISIINHLMQWDYANIPAIIAGIIIASQLTLQKMHFNIIFRMSGVLLGSLLAIFYILILIHYPSALLEGLFIVGTLTLCIFLAEKFPYLDYLFLQLGIIIPLILIHPNTDKYNISLALYRGFGSLEGAIIGSLMEYLFYFPLKKYQKRSSLPTQII